MSGEHRIRFSSVTVRTGAESAPPIWRAVSRVIFGLFCCHPSSSNTTALFRKEPVSANESSLNQRYNLFWGAVGFRLGACLILDGSNFNTKQDLRFLPILCSISVDLTVLADCQAHTQAEPGSNLTLAVSNIPQAAMEDS